MEGSRALASGGDLAARAETALGAPAARSFGPVSRFVAGTTYAARALTRRIAGKPRRELEPILMRPATAFAIGSGRAVSHVNQGHCLRKP